MSRNATWYIDSGCTAHLCNSEEKFTNFAENKIGTLSLASNDTAKLRLEVLHILSRKKMDVDERSGKRRFIRPGSKN